MNENPSIDGIALIPLTLRIRISSIGGCDV